MPKMKILDLFCCGGGIATGYFQGFSEWFDVEIWGVDICPQQNYPYIFVESGALKFLTENGADFDFLHASPPCQSHTSLNALHKKEYPCFIEQVRKEFIRLSKPYVIENVPGAPLQNPILICGHDLGMPMHGHRIFETSPFIL